MRGGSNAIWNFYENSSDLVAGPLPKSRWRAECEYFHLSPPMIRIVPRFAALLTQKCGRSQHECWSSSSWSFAVSGDHSCNNPAPFSLAICPGETSTNWEQNGHQLHWKDWMNELRGCSMIKKLTQESTSQTSFAFITCHRHTNLHWCTDSRLFLTTYFILHQVLAHSCAAPTTYTISAY